MNMPTWYNFEYKKNYSCNIALIAVIFKIHCVPYRITIIIHRMLSVITLINSYQFLQF